jgi:hypothetical protein
LRHGAGIIGRGGCLVKAMGGPGAGK